MKYPKSECCVEQLDCCPEKPSCPAAPESEQELLNKLSELQFAAVDLNLFLDTHPYDQDALTLYKNVVNTMNSIKYDYETTYGPLQAGSSSADAPFEWVSGKYKWPWQI